MLEDLVRPGALELAREAVRRGIDIEGMCRQPTYNQGCYGCGKHQGWGCVCRGEEKREAWERREVKMATPWFAGKWDSANLQTVSANPSDTKIANQPNLQTKIANLCACGRPKRPKGTDCWKCYRGRRCTP